MSYIQIDIGGKLRGLKFNNASMVVLSQKVDYNNYAATALYALVYAGLYTNEYIKNGGDVPDMPPFSEVCDWVDDLNKDAINRINETFQSTQAYKSLIPSEEKEEMTKKKPKQHIKKT